MKSIITVIFTTLLLCGFKSTFACICFDPTFEDAIKGAKEIFLGKVIHAEPIQNSEDYTVVKYTFEVIKKWKGNTSKYIDIYRTNSNCDLRFKVSETPVLVYAWLDIYRFKSTSNDKLATSQCSRTVISNNRREDKRQQFENDTLLLHQTFPNLITIKEKVTSSPPKIPWSIIGGTILLISFLVFSFTKSK